MFTLEVFTLFDTFAHLNHVVWLSLFLFFSIHLNCIVLDLDCITLKLMCPGPGFHVELETRFAAQVNEFKLKVFELEQQILSQAPLGIRALRYSLN